MKDGNGQQLAYVYYEEGPGRRSTSVTRQPAKVRCDPSRLNLCEQLRRAKAVESYLQPPKNAPKDKHNVHDARVLVCCGPGWTPLKTQMCSVFPDRRQTAVPFSYVTG